MIVSPRAADDYIRCLQQLDLALGLILQLADVQTFKNTLLTKNTTFTKMHVWHWTFYQLEPDQLADVQKAPPDLKLVAADD